MGEVNLIFQIHSNPFLDHGTRICKMKNQIILSASCVAAAITQRASSFTTRKVGDLYYNHYSNTAIDSDPFDFKYTLAEAVEQCNRIRDCMTIVKHRDNERFFLHSSIQFVDGEQTGAELWKKGEIWAENFVPRIDWGARDPVGIENFPKPASTGVMGHHTHWDSCFSLEECSAEVREIQDFHMGPGRNWWDIGYNFLIGEDGRIYEGRGFDAQGAHCTGWNTISYGFSMMGSFEEELPNEKALDAAKQLIEYMHQTGLINQCYGFYGHRDGKETECPGEALYQHFSTWPNWHQECNIYSDNTV